MRDGTIIRSGDVGLGGTAKLAKEGGVPWVGDVGYEGSSRKLDFNDAGFMARQNLHHFYADLEYRTLSNWFVTRETHTRMELYGRTNTDGLVIAHGYQLNTSWKLQNFWELFVEGQKLLGRDQLVFGHFVDVLAVGAIEREPDGQRQEISERERGFIEGAAERFGNVGGQRGLRTLEALEGVVELSARFFVIVGQAVADAFQGVQGDRRVRRDWTNGRATNPQGTEPCSTPSRPGVRISALREAAEFCDSGAQRLVFGKIRTNDAGPVVIRRAEDDVGARVNASYQGIARQTSVSFTYSGTIRSSST
jgi:hypothetical protein